MQEFNFCSQHLALVSDLSADSVMVSEQGQILIDQFRAVNW